MLEPLSKTLINEQKQLRISSGLIQLAVGGNDPSTPMSAEVNAKKKIKNVKKPTHQGLMDRLMKDTEATSRRKGEMPLNDHFSINNSKSSAFKS